MKTRAPGSLLPERDSPALKQPSRASTESCSDKRAAQESQLAARGNGPQTRAQAKPLASRMLRSTAHLPLQPRVLLWLPWPRFNSSKTQGALSELHTLHLPRSLPGNAFPCPLSSSLYSCFTPYRRPHLLQEGLSELPLLRRLSAAPRQPSPDVCVFHRLASPLACPLGKGRALILGPGTVSGSSWPLHEHCLMTK